MRTNTRYKEIYAAIKQDIEAGVYPINQKLPQGRLCRKISGQRTNHYKSLTFACARRLCCQTTWLGSFVQDFQNRTITKFLR